MYTCAYVHTYLHDSRAPAHSLEKTGMASGVRMATSACAGLAGLARHGQGGDLQGRSINEGADGSKGLVL